MSSKKTSIVGKVFISILIGIGNVNLASAGETEENNPDAIEDAPAFQLNEASLEDSLSQMNFRGNFDPSQVKVAEVVAPPSLELISEFTSQEQIVQQEFQFVPSTWNIVSRIQALPDRDKESFAEFLGGLQHVGKLKDQNWGQNGKHLEEGFYEIKALMGELLTPVSQLQAIIKVRKEGGRYRKYGKGASMGLMVGCFGIGGEIDIGMDMREGNGASGLELVVSSKQVKDCIAPAVSFKTREYFTDTRGSATFGHLKSNSLGDSSAMGLGYTCASVEGKDFSYRDSGLVVGLSAASTTVVDELCRIQLPKLAWMDSNTRKIWKLKRELNSILGLLSSLQMDRARERIALFKRKVFTFRNQLGPEVPYFAELPARHPVRSFHSLFWRKALF